MRRRRRLGSKGKKRVSAEEFFLFIFFSISIASFSLSLASFASLPASFAAMVLVLCIGDLHVPHRAAALPARFKALLVPGRIHHILCTGNLCTPVREAALLCFCRAFSPPERIKAKRINVPVAKKKDREDEGTGEAWRHQTRLFVVIGIKNNRWHFFTLSSTSTSSTLSKQESYDFLKSVCPDVRLCRGDFDSSEVVSAANAAAAAAAAAASEAAGPSSSSSASVAASGDETVLSVGGLRLGLAPAPADDDNDGNASDLLTRRLGVDVLVTSGARHELQAGARRGRLIVNPGSATGAWAPSSCSPSSSSSSKAAPSFVLMDCSEGRAVVYMYRLLAGDELKVEKLEYRKSGVAAAAPSPARRAAPAAAAATAAAPAAPPAAATTTAAS